MTEGRPRKVFKEEDMLTVSDFARKLPCSVRHAYNLVDLGKANGGVLSYRLCGRRGLKIPKTEVERFRQSRVNEDLKHAAKERV